MSKNPVLSFKVTLNLKRYGLKMFDIRKIQEKVIYDTVRTYADDETAKEIVYGDHGQCSSEDNPTWVKSTMTRLEHCFDSSTVKKIRMDCQCGYGIKEKISFVKDLVATSSSMEEFASHSRAKEAGLFTRDDELYLQFVFCPCPMLADIDRLETDTWCQCTTGYSKVLFEEAFNCKVEVELLKSIKMGHEICLMKIIPLDLIWK